MQDWLLGVVTDLCAAFDAEFDRLWRGARRGMLYPDWLAPGDATLAAVKRHIWHHALGFCGCEMRRRCLSLAHNADFETIAYLALRARLVARNLEMGRCLLVARGGFPDAAALVAAARSHDEKDFA